MWVEINEMKNIIISALGHSPRGECGLKFDLRGSICIERRVTPREGSVGCNVDRDRPLNYCALVIPREGSAGQNIIIIRKRPHNRYELKLTFFA